MKIVEISSSKISKMSDLVEDMLLAGGELMHCLSKMEDEMYGERVGSGRYSDSGMMGERRRMGMRHDEGMEDWDEMQPMMGERRSYPRRRRMY